MIEYFIDPILRAPAWGCMLMCLSSSLMGAVVFLRKKSLLAESLSHASYPGVVISVFILASCFPYEGEQWAFLVVLFGAFFAALLALKSIEWLEKKGEYFRIQLFVLSYLYFLGSALWPPLLCRALILPRLSKCKCFFLAKPLR